ncbi:hypothetical protein G6F21_014719 [Rhizopus arrhizus]|nr:hypothetical protein G6F21_014719 [Rhizopus arrhizus]
MASSTRIPMASTIANMVSTLMENPSASMTANEPSMATGTTRTPAPWLRPRYGAPARWTPSRTARCRREWRT